MATSQLIVTRYMDLLGEGKVEDALCYLAENVVYNTWLGVVYGIENVSVFLRDNIRFVHHGRNFNRWKQVQHSLDSSLSKYSISNPVGKEEHSTGAFGCRGDEAVRQYFNADGYDSQGYATFERDGTIASHAKFATYHVKVKETVVLRHNKVVLVNMSKRA